MIELGTKRLSGGGVIVTVKKVETRIRVTMIVMIKEHINNYNRCCPDSSFSFFFTVTMTLPLKGFLPPTLSQVMDNDVKDTTFGGDEEKE